MRVTLELADLLHVIDTLKRKYREQPVSSRDDFATLIAVYGLMIEQGYQIITNLYLPNANAVLLPGRLLYMNPLDSSTPPLDDFVHPAVDRRICVVAGCPVKKTTTTTAANGPAAAAVEENNKLSSHATTAATAPVKAVVDANANAQRVFPRVFGNKRLEGILARLDDDKIDALLVANMDEGNPQIILDYLLEANRCHSLSAFLSEDDVFVILKYFNDFLARNYSASTFHR